MNQNRAFLLFAWVAVAILLAFEWTRFTAAPTNTIFGRPANSTDHAEALGDSGDILFADWSQYLLAMKGTTATEMSIHLRFDYAETAFRSMFRVDGRPAWDTNMKPRKGAAARRVSPFVKLAARA